MKIMNEKKRIELDMLEKTDRNDWRTDLDCLRIIAAFAVMMLHTSSQKFYNTGGITFEWKVLNFYDSIVRWGVPVFVMISGTLFLDGNRDIRQIYKKNILRIVTAFIFWSTIYALVNLITFDCGWKKAILQIFKGHSHMGFLYMIMCLYIIVPFFQRIVSSIELTRYFLILSFVFTFILPNLISLISYKSEEIGLVANMIWDSASFHFTLGYVVYFVGGYYLDRIDMTPKLKRTIYLLGVCGFLITWLFTLVLSIAQQRVNMVFYGYFTVNVMLESIMIFAIVKNNLGSFKFSPKAKEILRKFSKFSFGAYLVHMLVLEQLERLFRLSSLSFNPIISVPLISIVIFIISFAISGILNCIPILNKYIV